MVRDFPESSLHKIALAINVCDSLRDNNEKIFRLNTTLQKCLWDIPEAVEMGFPQYLMSSLKENKKILDYHKINCKDYSECLICLDRKKIKNKLRNHNERTRPELYS